MQVIAELKKAFGVELPSVALYEAPTISTLAKYLNPPAGERGRPGGGCEEARAADAGRRRGFVRASPSSHVGSLPRRGERQPSLE
jgi:hypothetical protein